MGSFATFDLLVAHRGGPEPGWIQLVGWGPTRLTLNSSGAGSIINPAESASPGMLAVGAAHWNNVNTIRSYSSRGPTPGGQVKPDLVAADCGTTSSGTGSFCGTSQASPHVAGMAALVRQRFPQYAPAQVVSYLKNNAQQRISSPDPNNTWEHGFIVLPPVNQLPPAPSLPGSPVIFSVSPGTGLLTVSWRVPSQTVGLTISTYDLRHIRSGAPSKADANWTVARRVWTGSGSLSHTLTGLAGATSYDVQVRAGNAAGDGPWSATVSGAPPSALAPPGAPVFVSATPGSGTLTVVWSAPPDDGGSAVTSYDLRHIRSDYPSRSDANWSVSRRAVTGLGAFRYSLAGLMGGARYDVQVRAVNSVGEGPWSATASSTPLVQIICEDGNVVPNASSNTQLVSDCEALLAARDTLAGAGSLNWSGNTPMTRWQGVRLSGPPNRVVELRIQGPLQGQIAPELGRLNNLTLLDLSYNQLNGTIPAELGDLSSLRSLSLQGNQLTGPLPAGLGNLSSLELMQLWSNQLTGTMPAELGQLTNLEEMSFSDNRLTGAIPPELGRMTSLHLLALSGNRLTGSIPAELSNLANLQTLKLSGNRLTGCIPAGLRDVQDNDLTGLGLSDCGHATVPDAPTHLSAFGTAHGETTIYLRWYAPSSDGGAAITGYRVEVSDNGSNWTDLAANTDDTAIRYTHTGLTARSTRHYRVSAINSAGTGPESNTATGNTGSALPVYAPGAPTGLTTTANGQTQIDLSWSGPINDGGAAITGYQIEVSPDRSSWSALVADTGSTDTSYSHTGLTAESTRHYRVSAINSQGTGAASSIATATLASSQAVTAEITRCSIQHVTTSNGVTERWTRVGISVTVSAHEDVSRLVVIARTSLGQIGREDVATLGAGESRDFLFSGQPWRHAELGSCEVSLDWVKGTAAGTVATTPTSLTATADGQTAIALSWSPPSSNGGADITGYRIEVSENGSSWTNLVANTGNTATSYSHIGLTAGTTRHYRVSAINSAGTGSTSEHRQRHYELTGCDCSGSARGADGDCQRPDRNSPFMEPAVQ